MVQRHGKYGKIQSKAEIALFKTQKRLRRMNIDPLVSVIIYNYNYGRYLSACFDSVINQSYQNIEILFSDNASTDDSWKIAQKLQSKISKFIFSCEKSKEFWWGCQPKKLSYQHKR